MNKHLSFLLCLFLMVQHPLFAKKARVLFIGNSYTYTNDIPLITKNMAAATNDTLTYEVSAPGGMTLMEHCTNAPTITLIAQGNWDYVFIQEQSQRPSFPQSQVEGQVYPYAKKLDSMIHASSACAKTVFYMTWGRKNGDPSNCAGWPPVCTYLGMDSLLQLRYATMAADNNAWLAPVAKVWRRLRNQSSSIELYNPDESHPSESGSFAAACTFYSLLFGKDPVLNSYNYTLASGVATTIKAASKTVVYDSLLFWQRHQPLPKPIYSTAIATRTVTFTNASQNATSYKWTFGDGNSSLSAAPVHTYAADGVYNVCLTAMDNCTNITSCNNVSIGFVGVAPINAIKGLPIYPNPSSDILHIDGLKETAHYTITDMSGRSLQAGSLSLNETSIATNALASGTYFLEIINDQSTKQVMSFTVIR